MFYRYLPRSLHLHIINYSRFTPRLHLHPLGHQCHFIHQVTKQTNTLFTLLHPPPLQHPLIPLLSPPSLATPLRPKQVAAELPDSIQNSFHRHKLKISSGPNASHFPSLHSSNTEPPSSNTEPLSNARTV